jgi:PAS domain S-box-containing protein
MFESTKELEKYKVYVKKKLEKLNEIFSLASIGNFSKNIEISEKEDDFSQLYSGIQVMLDVIREKIAEVEQEKASLEVERNQLRTLVENLPVGVVIADVNSRKPILVNSKVEELLGLKPDMETEWADYAKNINILDPEGEEYKEEELPLITTLTKKVPVEKSDIVAKKKDGTETSLKIQSVPVLNERGQMYSAISVIHDISKEKELEKMKSDFISLASHQLRTPLGSMRWTMEMLIRGDYGGVEGEAKDVINRMHTSAIKLVRLVGELLSVFKLDEGKAFDVANNVDVSELIQKVIEQVRPLADEKKIEISFQSEKGQSKIKIDDVKLSEVIQNLISNAIKYNKNKGKVGVSLKKKDDHFLIKVTDTGIGISEREKDKIFEKFYRTEEASRREIDGTGLGLYLVKAYVKRWGGDVSFQSEVGKGSVFTVALPEKPSLKLLEK